MKRSRASLTSPNDPANRKTQNKNRKIIRKNKKINVLSEDEDSTDNEPTQKKIKIAPIVETDVDKDIHKIITDLKLPCDLKITSVGKKIVFKTIDDKTKIIEALDTEKIHYFSHPNDDSKTFKAVLCGLPKIETTLIADSLSTSHNITPTKMVMFNTKASSKLYLCHFDNGEVNMKKLNSIKTVYHHIVSWQAFKPKNKGPTQCYKCSMYGHGISSCKRFAVCMLCGGNHLTTACTVITKTTENPTFKCFNCESANLQHNHKANDINCPFRAKYIDTVGQARGKNKQKSTLKKNDETSHSPHSHTAGLYVKATAPPPVKKNICRNNGSSNNELTLKPSPQSDNNNN